MSTKFTFEDFLNDVEFENKAVLFSLSFQGRRKNFPVIYEFIELEKLVRN